LEKWWLLSSVTKTSTYLSDIWYVYLLIGSLAAVKSIIPPLESPTTFYINHTCLGCIIITSRTQVFRRGKTRGSLQEKCGNAVWLGGRPRIREFWDPGSESRSGLLLDGFWRRADNYEMLRVEKQHEGNCLMRKQSRTTAALTVFVCSEKGENPGKFGWGEIKINKNKKRKWHIKKTCGSIFSCAVSFLLGHARKNVLPAFPVQFSPHLFQDFSERPRHAKASLIPSVTPPPLSPPLFRPFPHFPSEQRDKY